MTLRNQPLGLPAGSVRAVLAFALVAGFIFAAITKNADAVTSLGVLATVVVNKYFKARNGDSIPKPEGTKE